MDAKTTKLDPECAQRFDAGRALCVRMVGANPSALREDVSNNKEGRWQSSPFVSLDGDLVCPSWAPEGPWERDPFASLPG